MTEIFGDAVRMKDGASIKVSYAYSHDPRDVDRMRGDLWYRKFKVYYDGIEIALCMNKSIGFSMLVGYFMDYHDMDYCDAGNLTRRMADDLDAQIDEYKKGK